ncbi:MAG: hypothetical protein WC732_08785 [Candidatus Omnitrophota bacterium]
MAETATCCKCSRPAYFFEAAGPMYCGRHAPAVRERLPKPTKQAQAAKRMSQMTLHQPTVEAARHTDGTPGRITLQRMLMMRNPVLTPGSVMIFPNNRHGNLEYAAFDCCELSPMRLGPVDHGQPGLPPACNIENFHQGTKCFAEEVDASGNPSSVYVGNRLRFYLDSAPHRHKFIGKGKNKNIPLFFVWIAKDGTEHRLTYVESRQFYCTFMERLASARPEYRRLQEMLGQGYHIQICGYDAYPFDPIADAETAYMDASKPFGHERVLAVMLANPPEQYPWRRHRTFEF